MRSLLLTLALALTAVVPTGCAFGFKSDIGRDREHTMLYDSPADPVVTPVAVR